MEKYRICGGKPLVGTVDISGAKNAVLPILAAVVLTQEVCCIENIPNISDVSTSLDILSALGAQILRLDSHTVEKDLPLVAITSSCDLIAPQLNTKPRS